MAEVTAAAVKELREKTGAGMMDCKKALVEANGDIEKATEILRKKGITIRKSNDCIIAATALEHHCQLLHNDKDFTPIADNYSLKIVAT